ncbi:MAG: DNA repair protein RadA [Mogibacterium sp.]|nr:DNA repair protein RadA [Mogibacterium sp.]
MAKKNKTETVYMCSECGNEFLSWQGQCSYCGAWNTIIEHKVPGLKEPSSSSDSRRRTGTEGRPVRLGSVGTVEHSRMDSGIGELNRVLGGGIVPGSLTLISGEPGIGKSTIIAQSANRIAERYGPVLYVSGEESEEQVKLRADRVCRQGLSRGSGRAAGQDASDVSRADRNDSSPAEISDNLYIYPETNIENILAVCEEIKPCFLIIDSIQTMYTNEADSVAGSITQIRACSNLLIKFAKTGNVPVFIVAHVTKSGELAGPKTIEHMVDCVLSFSGERDRDLRILRSFKNRFGTTDEIGAFRMSADGMIEVSDLSGSLIENDSCEEGSVISAVYEGSRPVFFEIQALVTQANVGFARRTAVGINYNRLSMILAVLEKKAGLNLLNYDVYVNVVGGMNTGSTATDLAVALAIYSSFRDRTASKRIVAVGEIGLTGQLRSISNADKIIQEAVRLGYEAVILPDRNARQAAESGKVNVSDGGRMVTVLPPGQDSGKGIRIIGASNIADAIRAYLS